MINPECSICNIINQPDNDDVTLFDNETVGTGWRIALMNDQGGSTLELIQERLEG